MTLYSDHTEAQHGIVIVTGSCCIPGMAPFDEQAHRAVEQALDETGITAQVRIMQATTAYMGGLPKALMAQLVDAFNQSGQIPLPAVLLDGEVISSGIPNAEDIRASLLRLASTPAAGEEQEGEAENGSIRARAILSGEDIIEMSGLELLHPGGMDLTRRIGELVHFAPSSRVLDVPSGKGVFPCFYAQEFGSTVTGIDIKEEFVALARRRAEGMGISDKVDFRVGDSRNLPFPDNTFDVAVNECAVGLMAIGDPQRVLSEMVRVARPGGKIIIHESTWLKELPVEEKDWAAQLMGTVPYSIQEWQQMLVSAGAVPEVVEDWSGIENYQKMRPGRRWSQQDPSDFLSLSEKLKLLPLLITRYPLSSLVELFRFGKKATAYIKTGVLGYALIVARKP